MRKHQLKLKQFEDEFKKKEKKKTQKNRRNSRKKCLFFPRGQNYWEKPISYMLLLLFITLCAFENRKCVHSANRVTSPVVMTGNRGEATGTSL